MNKQTGKVTTTNMTNSTFNRFTYIIGADRETVNEIIGWVTKSIEYINQFFGGNIDRAKGTKFGDCIAKVEYLTDLITDNQNNYTSSFRGVRDINGRLQAGAIISEENDVIYFYAEEREYLYLDTFTTPPWNCLEGMTFPETVKGAATWLIADIINETIDTDIEGVIKTIAIDRARDFYQSIGFEENPDFPREMILTREAALRFLQDQLRRRGS